jgi:DNA-directed RNA polymerase subunit K/omega
MTQKHFLYSTNQNLGQTFYSSNIEELLSRLNKVRRTDQGRWIARCPAHDDKNPSLAIRELDDGRILIKCFAGCDVHSVLAAVGLEINALFPKRLTSDGKPISRPFSAADALKCLAFEAMLVQLAAEEISAGKTLSDADIKRLEVAAARIKAALEVCHG